MKDLIEALTIFAKYIDPGVHCPTGCEHDELFVYVDPMTVGADDLGRLADLGFAPNPHAGHFYSFRFGSA